MLLTTAVIPGDDLSRLIESVTPARITIDEDRGRVVDIGRTKAVLVAGRGLRMRGEAHVVWDFAGVVPVPVTIRAWQLLLSPRITSQGRSHVLAFDPEIEELDIKLVPGFVDQKIVDAIRSSLEKNRDRLAWDLARKLALRLPLPAMISPPTTFELLPVGGDVAVSEADVRLALRFEARFERAHAGETAAAQ